MAASKREMQQMAAAVAKAMGLQAGKPRRHLVAVDDQSPERLNALQRDVLYSRIRDLVEQYHLGWLVRQETMHVMGIIECLPDDELTALLGKVERGVDAVMDGVAFVEVGLVKGTTCNWIA